MIDGYGEQGDPKQEWISELTRLGRARMRMDEVMRPGNPVAIDDYRRAVDELREAQARHDSAFNHFLEIIQ